MLKESIIVVVLIIRLLHTKNIYIKDIQENFKAMKFKNFDDYIYKILCKYNK